MAWTNGEADEFAGQRWGYSIRTVQKGQSESQRSPKHTEERCKRLSDMLPLFHDDVEELVDMEEGSAESKNKPKWPFDFKEAEGRKQDGQSN